MTHLESDKRILVVALVTAVAAVCLSLTLVARSHHQVDVFALTFAAFAFVPLVLAALAVRAIRRRRALAQLRMFVDATGDLDTGRKILDDMAKLSAAHE